MVGKVSERVLLREGLERTDNGMKQSSWPDVTPINQKNYYTEYMKRDDQIIALRYQHDVQRDRLVQNARDRDRALALNQNGDVEPEPMDDAGAQPTFDYDPSKIIVVHPGSQNLRIGFASDALPKTVPACLAEQSKQTESEEYEALPRRRFEAKRVEDQYGVEWCKKYKKMCEDLKVDMRQNKRKVLPNSKELVTNYNRRTDPEVIPQHNDPLQIDWTEPDSLEDKDSLASVFHGHKALRIPEDSNPKFKLYWPMQHGWLNEDDYTNAEHLHDDFEEVLFQAIKHELGLKGVTSCKQYSCIFVIPDLYDKKYVELALEKAMDWFEFSRIAFIQESLAATYGAGYTQGCVVDVGAQKTSIACVEDGMLLEDSRINLKYGGFDVTQTFIKMMLHDHFPYQEINLRRRYDFLLAEELKQKHCTMSQADISVQLYQFHLRTPNQPTHKYNFKTYDEVILAPMGFYDPSIFDNTTKLRGRRKLIDRSYNAYEVEVPDDPASAAQFAILNLEKPILPPGITGLSFGKPGDVSTPSKERSQPFNNLGRGEGTPMASHAGSPAPEGANTPSAAPFIFGAGNGPVLNGSPAPPRGGGTPAPGDAAQSGPVPGALGLSEGFHRTAKDVAAEQDQVLPIAPLDLAIMTSIQNAAKGDERKLKEFLGSIMVVGGGAKTPHFTVVLEERLRAMRPDLFDKILVSRSARDMDEQVVVWKGASVFAKLSTNDCWITPYEYGFHRSRILYSKALWYY